MTINLITIDIGTAHTFQRAVRREMELENWIKKYDNEIGEKQDEMETLGEEFNEETAQLRELEEKLQVSPAGPSPYVPPNIHM